VSATQTNIGIKPSHGAKYDGFEKPTPEAYNKAIGRQGNAPTSGGARSKADVLIAKGKAYGRSK
jgi:hypothetical protein